MDTHTSPCTWVYLQTESNLFTVGFFEPSGKWRAHQDFNTVEEARAEIHYLMGGVAISRCKALCMLCIGDGQKNAEMLTGYCIPQERCDGCRRVTDLALAVPRKAVA